MIFTTHKRPHRHEINWMNDKKDNLKKDRKSNLHHNATRKRNLYKQGRRIINGVMVMEYQRFLCDISRKDLFED